MRIVQELLKEANISIHELVQSCFYHYFASNSCWLQSWQIFFITFEKRSWKPATTNSSAKKLTKSTLKKKRCRKVYHYWWCGNFFLCNYRSTFQSSSRTFLYETIIIVTLRLGRRVQLLPNFLDKSQLCLTASQHESQNNS